MWQLYASAEVKVATIGRQLFVAVTDAPVFDLQVSIETVLRSFSHLAGFAPLQRVGS